MKLEMFLFCLRCFVQGHSSVLLKPSSKGFSIVVEFLLQNGADPNIADEVGNRLLKIKGINVKVSRVTFTVAALTGYCRFTCFELPLTSVDFTLCY